MRCLALRVAFVTVSIGAAGGVRPAQAAPPAGQSAYLSGMHDVEAASWMQPATEGCDKGWITDLQYIGIGGKPVAICHDAETAAGIAIVQRLDASYAESIPHDPGQAPAYAAAFAHFVSQCPAVHVWVVGNEPNVGWSQDVELTSSANAAAYVAVHPQIHALPGHGADLVLLAPDSPYSPACICSLRKAIQKAKAAGVTPDGYAVHAYTQALTENDHPAMASLVSSEQMSGSSDACGYPFHWHFRIYRDWISAIEAEGEAGRPVFLTESGNACAPQPGNKCYPDEDVGYFQAMWQEIATWNGSAKTAIRAITPYRWTANDDGTGRDFAIGQRPKLLGDLGQAFAAKHAWTSPGSCGPGPSTCKDDAGCQGAAICELGSSKCVATSPCGSGAACAAAEVCRFGTYDCVPATRGEATLTVIPASPGPGEQVILDAYATQGYTNVAMELVGPDGALGAEWKGMAEPSYHWQWGATVGGDGTYRMTLRADPGGKVYGIGYFNLGSPPEPPDAGAGAGGAGGAAVPVGGGAVGGAVGAAGSGPGSSPGACGCGLPGHAGPGAGGAPWLLCAVAGGLLCRPGARRRGSSGAGARRPPQAAADEERAASRAVRQQALAALGELLAGFQRADALVQGRLLCGFEHVLHAGLVSVLMRMLLVLLAEKRGLLPVGPALPAATDSLTALHAQLQAGSERSGADLGGRCGGYARLLGLLRLVHEGARDGVLPARGGALFDRAAFPFLEGRSAQGDDVGIPRVPDAVLLPVLDRLLLVAAECVPGGRLDADGVGFVYEGLMAAPLPDAASASAPPRRPGQARRRLGAHYTPRVLARVVVERALRPLLREDASPDEILALKICDPAMGSGAFLLEACRQLGDRLVAAWERQGGAPALAAGEHACLHARRLVAQRCLYGVDKNPVAVDLARFSLGFVGSAPGHPLPFVDHALRHGDALLGLSREQIATASWDAPPSLAFPALRLRVERDVRAAQTLRTDILRAADSSGAQPPAEMLDEADAALREVRLAADLLLQAALDAGDVRARAGAVAATADAVQTHLGAGALARMEPRVADLRRCHAPWHWEIELPEVFAARGGFDAFVGNPPWISYAGRAAQPLAADLRDFYRSSPAFAGFRNLQSLFVVRCAALLRPAGRLGFVLPTAMSDLGGYEPSRRAHDALCVCDDELPDFGQGAFAGVFQPCMALLSTRRARRAPIERAGPWPLGRADLDRDARALLERLAARPCLPPELFGERGFQTSGDDVTKLHALAGPRGEIATSLRVGGDIEPFLRRPPRLYCDPSLFGRRFRPAAQWTGVRLLIRQTARFPLVALSDGLAFRNSILAGFGDERWSEHFLAAYLNSSPLRFFHYLRQRDARQGMPQVKIAHLRALPAPDPSSRAVRELERLGRRLGERNSGLAGSEQADLDGLAADALGLGAADRARVREWAATVKG
ncbi:MAG: N-6 DNA methylase [Deltaproteobacteria bacterium]|nr:N-6 DNA methylase [Deltaproteobacteria bacterium]